MNTIALIIPDARGMQCVNRELLCRGDTPMKKIISPYARSTLWMADVLRKVPADWTWPLSVAVGRLLYWTRSGRRREVLRAYKKLCEVAHLERSAESLTKAFFDRQLMLMTANYILQGMPPERFEQLCDFDGLDGVREALSEGRGVIVTCFHIGTHLLSFAKLEREGYPLTTLRPAFMRDISDPRLRRMLFIHNGAIYVGDSTGLASPVREVAKTLRKGYIVGIAPDGDQGGGLTDISVLGGNYPIRRGLVEIAKVARSPMVFAFGVVRNKKFYVKYDAPWFVRDGDDAGAVAEAFLQDCARKFEEVILNYPECVWWTRPLCQALGLKSASSASED